MRFLFQPIRPYEFTAPVMDVISHTLLSIKPLSTFIFAKPGLRNRFTRRFVNERIVETPFIFSHISSTRQKILDVGACESPVALMCASLGHSVTALDTRPYPFSHTNIRPHIADIASFKPGPVFDTVICLSTLEHIGIGVYGNQASSRADTAAVKSMYHALRPGGQLLLTTPVSQQAQEYPEYRIYSSAQLNRLLKVFKSVKILYGVKNSSQQWNVYPTLVHNSDAGHDIINAVALVVAKK